MSHLENASYTSRRTPDKLIINVGSRRSQLALIQTTTVVRKLLDHYNEDKKSLHDVHASFQGGVDFNIVEMTTAGDRILDKALPDIGSKSLFTKDLEVAMLEGKVDFIVHSLKDLPTTLPEGCIIGAILKRDDPNDVVVLKRSLRGERDPINVILGDGSKTTVGTSSQRRIGMLLRCNPNLHCINIRGNLNTRLRKLDEDDGGYDAIVLAKAGLDRMGWSDRASITLTPESDARLSDWCYAVGQGAIAVECRRGDKRILDLLAPLCDARTIFEAVAERSLMKKLEGGCSVPLGVRSTWSENNLRLRSIILSLDGKNVVEASKEIDSCLAAGEQVVDKFESSTTGVAVSEKIENFVTFRDRILTCANLGTLLADEMIKLGCLELMRGIR